MAIAAANNSKQMGLAGYQQNFIYKNQLCSLPTCALNQQQVVTTSLLSFCCPKSTAWKCSQDRNPGHGLRSQKRGNASSGLGASLLPPSTHIQLKLPVPQSTHSFDGSVHLKLSPELGFCRVIVLQGDRNEVKWEKPSEHPRDLVYCPHPSSQQSRVPRLLWGSRDWELGTHHSSHKESLEGITLSIGIIVRVPCAGKREFLSRRCQQYRRARQKQTDGQRPRTFGHLATLGMPLRALVSPKHSSLHLSG